MLEVVEGGLSSLDVLVVPNVPEVMRCVLLCMLEGVEGRLCLPEVPEVMRCVLLCMLEAVVGRLCLPKVLEVSEVVHCVLLYMLEVYYSFLEVMRCVLLCLLEVRRRWRWRRMHRVLLCLLVVL